MASIVEESNFLRLDGVEGELRDVYTTKLKVSHNFINKAEDELVWPKNPSPGIYTPM